MIFRKIALGGAVISLANAGILQAADTNKCLAVAEAESLVTYLLPKIVEAGRTQCSNALPATAMLLVKDSERLAGYTAASEAAWPEAKKAVNIIADEKFPTEMDDALLRPIADTVFTKMIEDAINPSDCMMIDRIYTSLAPMPSANIASLTIAIVQAATENDEKTDIPICKMAP